MIHDFYSCVKVLPQKHRPKHLVLIEVFKFLHNASSQIESNSIKYNLSTLAKTILTLFSTRVKMSPYANPFIELAPVLDATPQINNEATFKSFI